MVGRPTERETNMAIIQGSARNDNIYMTRFFNIEYWHDDSLYGTEDADEIYGYAGNDNLVGRGGDDWVDGGSGEDLMQGGAGDDTYIVDNEGDRVFDFTDLYDINGQPINSYDTVKSYISYTLPTDIERLQLFDAGREIDGFGNELDNEISGNSYDNMLSGRDGEDTLWGKDGEDELYGEEEIDTLYGGAHDDRLYGGTEDDWLYGDAGNDTLDGGSGADVMRGGLDDDSYDVREAGDLVIEYADQGHDTVFSWLANYTLPANVEDLVLMSRAEDNGTGNGLGNQLVGNEEANTLNGLAGSDTLYGLGGDDTLVGGSGDDEMRGGRGNDTYQVADLRDVIVEEANEGVDTVESILSHALGDNVENLVLLGPALDGYGNSLANTITGNVRDNELEGGEGDDTIYGGGRDDEIRGGSGRDTLYGDGDSDTLYGGANLDVLIGGAGADHFVFDTAFAPDNVDIIADFNVADDTIYLENLVFRGLAMQGDLARDLTADEFRIGSAAQDATDRVIYNSTTGALLHDRDGTGAAAAVQFATLEAGLGLTQFDFLVI